MLTHQVQRSTTMPIIVLNYAAQFLPKMKHKGETILFDKILADVPCSGDGATRKLPNKWFDWNTNGGYGLHQLQLSILLHGIELLKPGGLLLYSTCSLNPIED